MEAKEKCQRDIKAQLEKIKGIVPPLCLGEPALVELVTPWGMLSSLLGWDGAEDTAPGGLWSSWHHLCSGCSQHWLQHFPDSSMYTTNESWGGALPHLEEVGCVPFPGPLQLLPLSSPWSSTHLGKPEVMLRP